MRRAPRSDTGSLLQEARAVEMLVNEAEITPDRMQEYWNLSVDLLNLVTDIEQLQRDQPDATYTDPEMLDLKRRLRVITSRLADLAPD